MKLTYLILTAWLIIATGSGYAQDKLSRVKIAAISDANLRNGLIGDLEIDHFEFDAKGAIITELNTSQLSRLNASVHKYEVLIPDLVNYLDSVNQIYYGSLQNNRSRVAFEQPGGVLDAIISKPQAFQVKPTFGGYYSFAEMETAMNNLVAAYPAIVQKISVGTTHEGRNIWVIKISDNVSTDELNEPEILYIGLQHAREAITGSSMIFFMQYLAENYATDTRIKNLVDNREIYIIPCLNPDGWEYNRASGAGSGWRKNRSPVDSSRQGQNWNYTYGVDLNRNWGVDWAHCSSPIMGNASSCGSSTKSSDTYFGASAFSERETNAVRNFVKSKHFVAGFDQHAYGPYYSLPFGRQSLHPNEMPVKGQQFYTAIPALMGAYNGMRAADSYDALGYEVAGGFKDWMLMGELGVGTKDTIWAMTGEGGAGGGTGGTYGSFWAPASQIINLSKGMCYQNLQLAFAAGTYVDIQDAGDIALTALSGNLNFRVKRLGLGNDAITVSLQPYVNAGPCGAPVVINSMNYYQDYNGSINYTLPDGITDGQLVKFIWKVEMPGYSYSDTIVKIYNPSIIFEDDMETGSVNTKWTVSNGWNYSSDAAYNGARSLTESPGGNYTNSSVRTAVLNTVLNLTDNTAAFLTFWTKHHAENFMDKLQVQVSMDGGSWVAIPGTTTKQEPGTLDGSTLNGQPALTGIRDYWTKVTYDLTEYKSANVRMQFVFTSNGASGSFKYQVDDGFYIDNIQVVKTTLPLTVLNNKGLKLEGRLLRGGAASLQWQPAQDPLHDHYEVEHSQTHSGAFTSIGKVYSEHAFNDNQMTTGLNYYRVRRFYKNGTTSYSNTIVLYNPVSPRLTIYPNPVSDELQLFINEVKTGLYTVSVLDLFGRKVLSVERFLSNSRDKLSVNLGSLAPQVYQLQVFNQQKELIGTQAFIKN